MDIKTILLGAAVGFLSAAVTDLDSYVKSRKDDPSVSFDWTLAVIRWFKGALLGSGIGVGMAQ